MIGERLKEIRKDRGDTQASLAEKLNVSLPTVKSWESEKSSPSHEMLVAICKLYQVSSDYLLGLSNVDPLFIEQNKKKLTLRDKEMINYFEEFLLYRQGKDSNE